MTKEQDKETIAATLYRIKKFGKNTYHIQKLVCAVEMEDYQITIGGVGVNQTNLWCNCPGFRIQQFPKIQHKHIKIGLDYRERGEPDWAEYRMTGTGKNAVIKFIKDSTEE